MNYLATAFPSPSPSPHTHIPHKPTAQLPSSSQHTSVCPTSVRCTCTIHGCLQPAASCGNKPGTPGGYLPSIYAWRHLATPSPHTRIPHKPTAQSDIVTQHNIASNPHAAFASFIDGPIGSGKPCVPTNDTTSFLAWPAARPATCRRSSCCRYLATPFPASHDTHVPHAPSAHAAIHRPTYECHTTGTLPPRFTGTGMWLHPGSWRLPVLIFYSPASGGYLSSIIALLKLRPVKVNVSPCASCPSVSHE